MPTSGPPAIFPGISGAPFPQISSATSYQFGSESVQLRPSLMRRTLHSTIPFFGLAVVLALTEASVAQVPEANHAIEKSLRYLETRAVAWMQEKKCASCHHVPMMIWAHREARDRGFAINEQVLTEVTQWMLDADKSVIHPTPNREESAAANQHLTSAYVLLALAAGENRQDVSPESLKPIFAFVLGKQLPDGSWPPPFKNPPNPALPPVTPDQHIASLLIASSLAVWESHGVAPENVKASRAKFSEWFAVQPPENDPLFPALRLILNAHLKQLDEDASRQIAWLRDHQNKDGGWSQLIDSPSDAFATGRALYAISMAGIKSDDPMVQRSRAYLLSTQNDDGTWTMASRPRITDGKWSDNLEPITSAGTAWATLGLLRSTTSQGDPTAQTVPTAK